ncbi:MAG: hypothetical protein QXV03_00900 [Sulfolobales archaeon]
MGSWVVVEPNGTRLPSSSVPGRLGVPTPSPPRFIPGTAVSNTHKHYPQNIKKKTAP